MKKKIITAIVAVLILAVILWLLQLLLVPKYMSDVKEGALIAEYYNEKTPHDVIFVGDCEVYEGISPITLWEKYGITSYIRGSSQQLIWQSYYLLEETFKYEKPKAVVFNVLSVKYGEPQKEAYNRMTLDGMKLSSSKINAIKASMTDEEDMLSYFFPLLRYHSRWSEIGADDFKYMFHRDTVSHNGYLMQTGIKPMVDSDIPIEELPDYTLPKTSMDYLDRMAKLCEENGVELILIKSPTNTWKYWWYDEWDAQIVDFAKERNLAYYNFIGNGEIGIDWSTDTYDGGVHLNVYGVEKFTEYFGKILSEDHGVEDRRSDGELSRVWAEKTERYNNEKNSK